MVKGWLKISDPEDLERALVRMLNKILASTDPVAHAGRFASLANAWTNAHRLGIEIRDLRELQAEIEALKEQQVRRG